VIVALRRAASAWPQHRGASSVVESIHVSRTGSKTAAAAGGNSGLDPGMRTSWPDSIGLSSSLLQGRQHVLPECVDKAQLPPPDLMQVDFGEPHFRVLAQPRSVLSQVRGDQD
jgi:hypothetical protein